MWEKIKSAFSWSWKRIKKHPRLAIFSTIALAATAYFILPIIIGITTLSVGVAAITCAIMGPVLGGILGWAGQKIGLIKPDPIHIRPPDMGKKSKFEQVTPEFLKKMLAPHLDAKGLTTMTRVSRTAHASLTPFIPDAKSLTKFLRHVAYGEQNKAENMLKEEAKRSGSGEGKEEKIAILSRLLTTKGTMTDFSGRTFTGITALQFALWAKDRHMWQMLLKYLPADIAFGQYKEHKKQGVSYLLAYRKIKENHYDFSPLTNALQQHVTYMNTYGTRTFDWVEADRRWMAVGDAQRDVPAHVAHEYLREDRSFVPTPTFDEPNLPRTLHFFNRFTYKFTSWFSDRDFGVDLSVYREGTRKGAGMGTSWASGRVRDDRWQGMPAGIGDLAAVTALCKVRTQEYDALLESLNAQLHPADDQPKVAAPASSPRPS